MRDWKGAGDVVALIRINYHRPPPSRQRQLDAATGVIIAPLAAVLATVDLGGDGASSAAGERVCVGVAVWLAGQRCIDRRSDEVEHLRTSGTE